MVSSLQVQTTSVTHVPALEVNSESIQADSSKYSTSSLHVSPGQVSTVSSLHTSPSVKKVSNLERIAAQLQANKLPKTTEVKTEAVTTSGLTTTNSTRGPDLGQAQSVTTHTVNKMTMSPVDTTTSQVTPVTTVASTTTAQESVLGKRVRRQSSKYEDYEQQTLTVCHLSVLATASENSFPNAAYFHSCV